MFPVLEASEVVNNNIFQLPTFCEALLPEII